MNRIKGLISSGIGIFLAFIMCTGAYGEIINLKLFYDGKNHSYSAGAVNIEVDGKKMTGLDMPPVIINERTLIPARAVFEAIGAQVNWNEAARQVYVNDDENVVVLTIDSKVAYKNSELINMDVAPKIINDRTMIPVRYAAEALDCTVGWDELSRTVTIESKNYNKPSDVIPPSSEIDIPKKEDYINVTGVVLPSSASAEQKFIIKTDGEITKFEDSILTEDRLIIDIYGAENALTNGNIPVSTSSVVKSVRSAQFQSEPEKIARVVFDLTYVPDYEVSLSSNKKQIEITFTVSYLEELEFSSSGGKDKITLFADAPLNYKLTQSVDPNTLTIDVYGVVSELRNSYSEWGEFVRGITVSEPEANTARIVIETDDIISFEESAKGKSLTVTIAESTLKNISYNRRDNAIILKDARNLDIRDFEKDDRYTERQYIVSLDGDYEDEYGYGKLYVNDEDGIEAFEIKTKSGNTEIIIYESSVIEVDFDKSSDEIYILGLNPKDVYDTVIVVDPGHGKQDPGASGNGIIEKNANLSVIKHLYSYLEDDRDFKVYATRLDDSYPANADRAKMANKIADMFISVHMNSALNLEAKGTEVLYMNHSNESQSSGKLTSKRLAEKIQENLIDALGTEDRGIKERPDLIVLNSTTVPAVLIEVGFISNEEDASVIASESGKKDAAEAIYEAICSLVSKYDLR